MDRLRGQGALVLQRIEGSGVAKPVIYQNSGWASLNMNMKEGLLTLKKQDTTVEKAGLSDWSTAVGIVAH